MPITYVIDERLKLVRTDSSGAIRVQEIIDHLSAQRRYKTVP